MKVNLPFRDFSFFKVVSGFFILAAAVAFPIVRYISIVVLIVGKAHSFGAWVAMWRAGKFNWKFVTWGVFSAVAISYWAFKLVSLPTLALVAFCLFAFHFIFDEFDLQGEEKTKTNVLLSLSPFLLSIVYLLSEYFHFPVTFLQYLSIAGALLILELIYVSEINWFVIRTKMLEGFILLSIYIGLGATSVMFIFLIDHYFFWLVYPVYRLHKYNRPERDGFIMMLIIIVILSVFIFSGGVPWTASPFGATFADYIIAQKVFFISSIAHIVTTPPFSYLFGVSKPRKYAKT